MMKNKDTLHAYTLETKKPTIMHVIDSLNIGGAERMLVEIANHTDKELFNVSICITRTGNKYISTINHEIPIYYLNRKYKFDIIGILKLSKILNSQRVDILHVHGRSSLSLSFVLKLLKIVKAPILFHDHNGLIEIDQSIPFWFKFLGRFYVAHYVGVSTKLSEWAIKAGISPQKISVIENALDLKSGENPVGIDFSQEKINQNKEKSGIFVGGLRPQKGLELLINAVNHDPKNREAVFWIVGKEQNLEYIQDCKHLINKYNLNENFIFLGERTDVVQLIRKADFAVIPSISESGPLVLIEFLANNLPIVAFNTGSICLQANSLGVPGFVTPGSIEEFSKELRNILSLSERERHLRGKKGAEITKEYFSIHTKMRQWIDLYRSILKDYPCVY